MPRKRNPDILLLGLQWGAPGWIGDGEFYSDDNIDYLVDFLRLAEDAGAPLDYLGVWNEHARDNDWIKALRRRLDEVAPHVGIVAPDEDAVRTKNDIWSIADDMAADPELARAVAAIGAHYPYCQTTEAARDSGMRLWSSEDGPWSGDYRSEGRYPFPQVEFKTQPIPVLLNRNYIDGRMTSTIIWSLITSYYDWLPYPGSGLMRANQPWSGHYEIQWALWSVAHTTRFTKPGWTYVDAACGYLDADEVDRGSFVTLVSPSGTEATVVAETLGGWGVRRVQIDLPDGLQDHARGGSHSLYLASSFRLHLHDRGRGPKGLAFSARLRRVSIALPRRP